MQKIAGKKFQKIMSVGAPRRLLSRVSRLGSGARLCRSLKCRIPPSARTTTSR